MARHYSALGRFCFQHKCLAQKRVWNTSQITLGFHTCKCIDLIQILKLYILKNIKGLCALCSYRVINQHSAISVDLDTSAHYKVVQALFNADTLYCTPHHTQVVSFAIRPQGIMLQILLIMLFRISLKNPSLCSLLFFSLLLLFYCTNNNTMHAQVLKC